MNQTSIDNDAPEIAVLSRELAALQDRYLRFAAHFDNFKRRTAREAEGRAAAQKDAFIGELLPVMDNLERALGSPSGSTEQLRTGVEMTLQQLCDLLRRHGCEPDDCCGQPFDPHRQEAVGSRRDSSQPDHVVLKVVQRGWRRGEKLLRPARVIINDLSASTDENAPDPETVRKEIYEPAL
jgi:molecular chaperone GrpE